MLGGKLVLEMFVGNVEVGLRHRGQAKSACENACGTRRLGKGLWDLLPV